MDYNQLNFSRFETRFLRLVEHKEPGHLLRFDVVIASFSSPPDYNALSYCWGDVSRKSEIEVSGMIVEISQNLQEALHYSNLAVGDLIWADAICINQADLFEKSYQVNMMGQIYSKAKKVIVWLGVEERNSHHAATFLRRLSTSLRKRRTPPGQRSGDDVTGTSNKGNEIYLELLGSHDHPTRTLQALSELLSRPYWERVWIIQEISKARKVEIRCGQLKMDLGGILCAATWHMELLERNRSLLAAISEFRAQEQRAAGGFSRMPLIQAMLMSRFSLATDQRDKVYALLGLASDGADLVPTPTYTDPVPEVFERLTEAIIQTQQPTHVSLLAKRAPLSYRFPGSSPWAIDWGDLAYNVPPWLIHKPDAIVKPTLHSTFFKNSTLYTCGERLGFIDTVEGSDVSWTSYKSDDDEFLSSASVMSDLCSDILDRLSLGDVAVKEMDKKDLTDALSRMIRDADKGFASAKYNFPRVHHVLSRLKDLYLHGMPIWEWARKYNYRRARELRQSKEAVVSSTLAGSQVQPQHFYNPMRILRSFWQSLLESSSQKATTDDTEPAPTIVAPYQPFEGRFEETQKESLDTAALQPPLLAFRLWEDIIAEFNALSEYQLQFAIANGGLVLVPREAMKRDCIYQIDHCTLPVVLRSNWKGEYKLIGEAYIGRQSNGDWLSAIDSSFPDAEQFLRILPTKNSKDLGLGIRVNLSSQSTGYALLRYSSDSDSDVVAAGRSEDVSSP